MIQIYGSADSHLRVSQLAQRLDISPAFASSLVRELVDDGLARRSPDPTDQRATLVTLTDEAIETLAKIDDAVAFHVNYFAAGIPKEIRQRALSTLKQYVGIA